MAFSEGQSVALFRCGKITGRGTVEKVYEDGVARIALGGGFITRVQKCGFELTRLSGPLRAEPWDAEKHGPILHECRTRSAIDRHLEGLAYNQQHIPADKLDEALALARRLSLLVKTGD